MTIKRVVRADLWLWVGLVGPLAWGQTEETALRPVESPVAAAQPVEGPTWLRVAGERVYLRSRPDLNSLPVAVIERDTPLQATGQEFGWYRVVPPPGAFSYVAAAYIEERPDGTGVVATQFSDLRVRVGSLAIDADPLQCEVQARLARGAAVRIVGRVGEWYQIVPPEGVYFYVAAQYAEPISDEVAARLLGVAPVLRPQWTATTQATQPAADTAEQAAARERAVAQPRPPVTSAPVRELQGRLVPSYVLPPNGGMKRYKLQDPVTEWIEGYVEFPAELGIDPETHVGKYVRVKGMPTRDAQFDVEVIRATALEVIVRSRATTRPSRPRP